MIFHSSHEMPNLIFSEKNNNKKKQKKNPQNILSAADMISALRVNGSDIVNSRLQ